MANDVNIDIGVESKSAEQSLKKIDNKLEKLSKNAEKGFKASGVAWGSFVGTLASSGATKAIAIITGAFGGMVDVFKEGIEASQVQQDAMNKLAAQMKINGDFSKEAAQGMFDFASGIQSVSKFGDEAVIDQLAFAKAMGASNEQAKKIIKASIDLAASTGQDLNSAVRNVSKTLGGMKGELGEVIPEMAGLTAEQLKAGAAIDIVARKFKGAAEAELNTFSGKLQQAKNSWGDMLEKIGDFITTSPVIIKLIGIARDGFDRLGKMLAKNNTVFKVINATALFFVGAMEKINGVIASGRIAFAYLGLAVDFISKKFNQFILDNTSIANFLAPGKIKDMLNKLRAGAEQSIKEVDLARKNFSEKIFSINEQEKTAGKFIENISKQIKAATKKKPVIVSLKADPESVGKIKQKVKKIFEDEKGRNYSKEFAQGNAGAIFQGEAGARSALQSGAGMVGDVLFKGFGGAIGTIVGELAKGPEHVKTMMNGFVDALPTIIKAIADSIPVVIEVLIERAPDIIEALASASPMIIEKLAEKAPDIINKLVEKAPDIAIALVKSFAKFVGGGGILGDKFKYLAKKIGVAGKNFIKNIGSGAKKFVTKIIDGIKDLFKKVTGGGIIGKGKDLIGKVGGFIKKLFASGGIVAGDGAPITGDKVLIRTNPGEMVLNQAQQGNLFKMINSNQNSGSGGIVLNIQGNVIADDESQVNKLINKINDALQYRNATLRV